MVDVNLTTRDLFDYWIRKYTGALQYLHVVTRHLLHTMAALNKNNSGWLD